MPLSWDQRVISFKRAERFQLVSITVLASIYEDAKVIARGQKGDIQATFSFRPSWGGDNTIDLPTGFRQNLYQFDIVVPAEFYTFVVKSFTFNSEVACQVKGIVSLSGLASNLHRQSVFVGLCSCGRVRKLAHCL